VTRRDAMRIKNGKSNRIKVYPISKPFLGRLKFFLSVLGDSSRASTRPIFASAIVVVAVVVGVVVVVVIVPIVNVVGGTSLFYISAT